MTHDHPEGIKGAHAAAAAVGTDLGGRSRGAAAAAALTAQSAGFEGTDDCSLVERIGHKIALVETGRFNLKITVPEDLAEADWILSQREE